MKEQKEDEKVGRLYCYFENPDAVPSANMHMYEKWSQSSKLIDVLLLY